MYDQPELILSPVIPLLRIIPTRDAIRARAVIAVGNARNVPETRVGLKI